MAQVEAAPNVKKRRRGKKNLNKISFEAETVTKSEAQHLLKALAEETIAKEATTKNSITEECVQKKVKRDKKKNKIAQTNGEEKVVVAKSNAEANNSNAAQKANTDAQEVNAGTKQGKRKRRGGKKRKEKILVKIQEKLEKVKEEEKEDLEEAEESDKSLVPGTDDEAQDDDLKKRPRLDQDVQRIWDDKKISIRSAKRKKYEELMAKRKQVRGDLSVKRGLEYLSNYKHNRDNWKFEKMRQVWVMQNVYNENNIDEKFFDLAVEYFIKSRGSIRKALLEEAVNIIEMADLEVQEADVEENESKSQKVSEVKISRARALIQSLSE